MSKSQNPSRSSNAAGLSKKPRKSRQVVLGYVTLPSGEIARVVGNRRGARRSRFAVVDPPVESPRPGHEPPMPTPATASQASRTVRIHTGFDRERARYSQLKPGLLRTDEGRFVVLVGDEMVGPWDSFREAYLAGRRRFGPGPLYIKQVLADEPIFQPITIESCPS